MRNPGVFSSWTDCDAILTKDHFLHVYGTDKKNDKKQQPQEVSKDFSNPTFSINLNNLEHLDISNKLQKELKIELAQKPAPKINLNIKETQKELAKLNIDMQCCTSISNQKL